MATSLLKIIIPNSEHFVKKDFRHSQKIQTVTGNMDENAWYQLLPPHTYFNRVQVEWHREYP